MGLRVRLATTFLVLLALAVGSISVLDIDRTLKVLANDLVFTGDRITNEIFEQMRAALASSRKNPELVLEKDPGLSTVINSSRTFGKGVLYVYLESPDGRVITPSSADPLPDRRLLAPGREVLSLDVVDRKSQSQWPLALLPALWGDHTYEIERPVELDGKKLCSIRVGLSTGLITHEVRRLVGVNLGLTVAAIVFSAVCAALLGNALLRPVLAVASGLESLAYGSGEVSLELGKNNELSTLADKFNQLSRRVRADRLRWENERGHLFDAFRSMTEAVILVDADGTMLFANA